MQQHSSQQGQHACQANLLRVCHTRGESFLLKNLPQIKKVSTVTVATGAAAKNLDAGDYPRLFKLYAIALHLNACYTALSGKQNCQHANVIPGGRLLGCGVPPP